MNISSLTRPQLLLNKEICVNNIERMAKKAELSGAIFRPHFKTHQSVAVGAWYRDFGVRAIAVSSVKMAAYFADQGWDDITIALPVNICELDAINDLAQKISLNLLLDDVQVVQFLDANLLQSTGVFLKVDCGYQRTGIDIDNGLALDKILNMIKRSAKLHFMGFLTHSGHTYHTSNTKEILDIHHSVVRRMKRLKQRWSSLFPDAIISIGDTPSMSLAPDFDDIDEVRPGNFVFYDLMQRELGVCTNNQIAVAVACPVIGLYPQRNSIVIHGGGVHFSKESLQLKNGNKIYGSVVFLNKEGWSWPEEEIYLTGLSQEHGTITAPQRMIKKLKHGDFLGVVPVHSCLTAACFDNYLLTNNVEIEKMISQ